MKIIPAIDLHEGKCVRLYKGDFDRVTHYSDQPLEVARAYAALSVDDLHIVDLDGARTGSQQNARVVRQLCADSPLVVQLGGGIRDGDRVKYWLENGVTRCVVGSVAVAEPERVAAWIDDFGADSIVLALDVTIGEEGPVLATHGWTQSTGLSLWDLLDRYSTLGAKHLLCTDISRDGAMSGPNVELYTEILRRYPDIRLQASGGVRDIGDIRRLKEIGAPAAITGKAMLDGKISAAEVDSFLRSA
ncbi:MAG: 1-(5-phosphoribosyl)-5-[(5-phosphoribosylamino)methylideneamino]imidazole-4-carboxamide isomerase [Gammaproteobacteria bacterium]|nr:1-(5-phosphoribosyl)-5-[(5-phosphoribosylamino)methylideneamino]imidazole-4-carboxamide isomerase [Gammaproteobacteria bacterium]MDH3848159.1 1-(5-phosphoribosyl)-5-[(5-phosphoribosylamino)methylideneamino]imidazole-4-carboxamide isomerase [Gammaproteobacteria bacterium]MDH3863912.1 1-(5-phosphoribosyl)-5-[(5-phosphoribosylamino)methylideneamino]imidazole-4-carboxamide isomerase [Gammaproteobacteria bacterium]MDH3905513.1 1-(5-phosphoribosyl)-5-[(5-phosphoribosylamino)methylideneamino]imidazo